MFLVLISVDNKLENMCCTGEWEVLDAAAVYRKRVYGDCCGPEELIYPDVTYWITLKRKVVVIWFVVEIMPKHVTCSY